MRSRPLARIATTDAREQLAELVNAVAYGGARIVLQRHGRNVAALVSLEDLQQLGVRLGRDVPEWTTVVRAGKG
ncbi:MAG: type II toxin-antitoxin system Phd/YefM family antitoxin [Gemmatimonadetes bacterium]|nr:type II toxin-antitoxin system Phd/YefM family antitoxin [Gemmatimonadota bacterium]